MKKAHPCFLFVFIFPSFNCSTAAGCTDFLLPNTPGSPVISGRTMDFSPSVFQPIVFKIPKGIDFTASSPGGQGAGTNGQTSMDMWGSVRFPSVWI